KTELQAAVTEYHKADAIKPDQQGVLMQEAKCAMLNADAPGAEHIYLKLIAQNKTFQQPYNDLYRLYMIQGKKDEGEKLLKTAFQNNPKAYPFLAQLAYLYSVENRRQDMVDVLQQIKSHAKDYSSAYKVVGDFYVRLNDPDGAIREYKEGM